MNDLNAQTEFIKSLKQQIVASRYIVARLANAEMLRLYYGIGKSLDEEFENNKWGAKVIEEIANRLYQEIPGLRGFSGSNLRKMRIFYQAWRLSPVICSALTNKLEIETSSHSSLLQIRAQSPVPENRSTLSNKRQQSEGEAYNEVSLKSFLAISFSHHFEILSSQKNEPDRWYYILKTEQNFWSVRHLRTELSNLSHLREQNMPNNFATSLPDLLSNKALKTFKDQYLLDFINTEDPEEEIDERVLEHEIVQNIKKFLMSLGTGFSFIGNQFRLVVEEEEYFIDLLFFHRSLQALVAFELKKGKFKPEYVGKMNFYLSALDDLVKQPHENPSIGIILCKEKNNKKVEYSFRDVHKPMGVSVYKTTETLPPELRNVLPDAESLKKLLD
jgi:predicted nuclease of restriction endonuclease-like (RecB) superfamily